MRAVGDDGPTHHEPVGSVYRVAAESEPSAMAWGSRLVISRQLCRVYSGGIPWCAKSGTFEADAKSLRAADSSTERKDVEIEAGFWEICMSLGSIRQPRVELRMSTLAFFCYFHDLEGALLSLTAHQS